jgi:hypothetical protein
MSKIRSDAMKCLKTGLLVTALVSAPACAPTADVPGADESYGADGGDDSGASGSVHAYVTTASSDYATGAFATVDMDDLAVQDELFPVAGDASAVATGGLVFQLNRFGYDTVRRYTPGEWTVPDWEVEVGDLSNPVDAEVCDGRLFVSLYGTDHLGIYNVDTGLVSGAVDLSAFADGDGVGPEPAAMVQVGGRLYVGLNRLDRTDGAWSDAGGMVVEVDCAAGQVTDSWDVGGNTEVYDAWDGQVVVGARAFGDQSGGIWVVQPGGGAALVVDLDAVGQDAVGAAVWGDRAVVLTMAADYSGHGVHCLDLTTGELDGSADSNAFLSGVVTDGAGEAWVTAGWSWLDPEGERPGIDRYDVDTCARVGAPIRFSLAPSSVSLP